MATRARSSWSRPTDQMSRRTVGQGHESTDLVIDPERTSLTIGDAFARCSGLAARARTLGGGISRWAELILTGVQAIPNVGPAAATHQAGEVAVGRRCVSPLRGYPGGADQQTITAREPDYAARRTAHA